MLTLKRTNWSVSHPAFTAALTAWRTSCLQSDSALENAVPVRGRWLRDVYTHRGLLRRSTTWHLISSSSIADALARYAALAEFSADKVLCRIYSSARFSYSFCHLYAQRFAVCGRVYSSAFSTVLPPIGYGSMNVLYSEYTALLVLFWDRN
jgi:hypothetical protein